MLIFSEFEEFFQNKCIPVGILGIVGVAFSVKQPWAGIFIPGLLMLILLSILYFQGMEDAEQSSRECSYSQDEIKRLLNLVPTPVVLITKADWQLVQLNRAASDLFALAPAVAAGKYMTDFFGTDQKVWSAWRELLHYGVVQEELPLYRHTGVALVMAVTGNVSLMGKPHLILSMTDITAKHIEVKRLEQLATIDGMTGLLNRQAFQEKLVLALKAAGEEKRGLCLAYMDLDGLKQVNDTYGHREGDWYINIFATLLRNGVSENDFVGRVGGDEFAIVFTKCSQQTVEVCIRKMQQQLELTASRLEKPYTMQVSVGMIAVPDGENIDVESLLHKADYAMYQQKYVRQPSPVKTTS